MTQLLDRAELDKPHRDHVKVMLEAGKGLQMLLDDVIALARDGGSEAAEDSDPVQAARAVGRLLQPRAWEKRLRLTVTAASNLPHVALDGRRLRQALLKLVDNALKFTERGLVDIRLDASEDGQSVRFCVSDTGHGVAPGVADILFSPFALGDSSYARKQQGAGLGLAVAKRVIEQAGGSIGFTSKPEGAQFFFTLPVSGIVPAIERDETENKLAPSTGLSLLLFLPVPQVADAVIRLLEPFGNRVTRADSLAEAEEQASREYFDAIIAGASDADMLAAAPGATTPLIAILLRGSRAPTSTGCMLRWPIEADQLYRALDQICQRPDHSETEMHAAIDPVAFSTLEKSVGMKALVEILQCYIETAEQLTGALAAACSEDKWEEAARLAQDIIGAAGGLGLAAITLAAREFARLAREGQNRHQLRNAAQIVVGEHLRVRRALTQLYPEVV